MSKLNGQYGIVDESDSNRTIISLKLTPAAAEKIKKFIESRGIGGKGAINFSAHDEVITEGCIKFGSEKIGFESQASREDDILSHSARQDHFTNHGVSKQFLKVKADIESSAKVLKANMAKIEEKDEAGKAIAIKMKGGSRKAGSYVARREKLQASNKTYPPDQGNKVTSSGKSSSGLRISGASESRPSTPVNASHKQFGSIQNRVLHILALQFNKSKMPDVSDLKRSLHDFKLATGSELKMVGEEQVKIFLSKNGIDKKGTKYQVRRECLDKIDPNWAGYTPEQKSRIQELIQEAKRQKIESAPVQPDQGSKRKSMDQSVSGQRPPGKRPRPPSNLSPGESSESSDSPGSHSTMSQSTASEKSVTPHKTPDILPSLSPVLAKKEHKKEPGKSSVVDDYRKKKEEAKLREKREREKAERQKMTHAEVQKNYQEQKDYENTVSNDLPKAFPTIMNQQNAKKYEDQFNSDFAEYEKMKPAIDQVCAVFDSLEKDMRRCKEGTKEFKEIYKSAMNEYKRQVQKGFFEDKKKYVKLYHRLRHLKKKLNEWKHESIPETAPY